MRTIEHWIAGKATGGSSPDRAPVFNPATGQSQAQVVLGDARDVQSAVLAASEALDGWSESSLSTRTKVLFSFRDLVARHSEDLARIICDEHGKVIADARGEVQRGLEVVEFACGVPQLLKGDYSDQASQGVDVFSYRRPLGVVAGITPFNFPVMVPMWMYPLAIACGNTFVLKPSEKDPSASLLIAELWAEAGLPEGVFNVVQGATAAVESLLGHRAVAAVSFVGSTDVARRVYERATSAGKRAQALGSAKNHAVVLPDADADFASDQLVSAAFGSAGQRCMAVSAAVAVGEVGADLVDAVRKRGARVRVGPGSDEASEMGPLITAEARDRVQRMVASGEQQGASVILDGRGVKVPGYENGFFVGPTVLDEVTPTMDVYRNEVFGPVLSILRTESVEEAIALVNSNRYGNGAAVFTSSGEAARRFHRSVNVGMVGINVPIPVPMAYHSFGGWKDSLFGDSHVHGLEGVSFYTRGKVVTSRWLGPGASSSASYHFPTST